MAQARNCLRLDGACSPEEAASCGWCDMTAPTGYVETLPKKRTTRRKPKKKPLADVVRIGFGSEKLNWRSKVGGRRPKRAIVR